MLRFGTPSSSSGGGGILHVVVVTLLLLLTTRTPDGSSGRRVAAFLVERCPPKQQQQQQQRMLALSGGGSRGTKTTFSPAHHRRRDVGRSSLSSKTAADVDKMKEAAAAKADKVEIAIDIAIFVTVQLVLRTQFHCAKVATCECPDIIPYARGFFVVTNLVLLGIYANQLYVANSLPPTTPDRTDDIAILKKKIKKGVFKPLVLGAVHLKFGIMACLIASSCIAINSLPFWRQRETSFYKKYGLGRFQKQD